jgi:hypothetical protein
VATAMAQHWKAEREAKPCNGLLQFLGEAVDHEAAQAAQADPLVDFAKLSKFLQRFHVHKRRQILSRWSSSARLRCPGWYP